MTSIYLHKREIEAIVQFMEAFSRESYTVEIISEGESGIGSKLTAKLHGVRMNDHLVDISTTITDESDW